MKQVPVIFSLFGGDELSTSIQEACHYDVGNMTVHQFPDEETVITIESDVLHRTVFFIASLDRPNPKLLPLLLAAETARSLGASKVVLIAPYLAYMRQDKVFEPGQGVTSAYFAKIISRYFDGLITIDPHLHRWHSLSAIYDVPTYVLHATDKIAHWIDDHIKQPMLIGPDAESLQTEARCLHHHQRQCRKVGISLGRISTPWLRIGMNCAIVETKKTARFFQKRWVIITSSLFRCIEKTM